MAGEQRVRVRAATCADMTTIHRMIHDLATFEGVPDGPKLSVEDLIEDGFESSPAWFFALVAERGGGGGGGGDGGDGEGVQTVGYALCNRAYSSWTRRALYIEDLYVAPDQRRAGVGTALLQHIAQLAMEGGVYRIDWHVLESNESARAFYAKLGARDLRLSEGRAALRLDRQHIERLATGARPSAPAPAPPSGLE